MLYRKLSNDSKKFFSYKIFRFFYTYKSEKYFAQCHLFIVNCVRSSSLIVIRLSCILFAWKLELLKAQSLETFVYRKNFIDPNY